MLELFKFELRIERNSLNIAKLKNFNYDEFFELFDP
jgi:hypothetical protein